MRTIKVVLSDLHGGSPTALSTKPMYSFSGADVVQNDLQKKILEQYEEGMCAAKQLMTRASRMVIIINGDPVERANHHGNTQQMSGIDGEHIQVATDSILHGLKIAGYKSKRDILRMNKGTEAHAGNDHWLEEIVAKNIGAQEYRADKRGRHLWPFQNMDINGQLFYIRHHPPAGVGSMLHTRGRALVSRCQDMVQREVNDGSRVPDWFIFSHFHQYINRGIDYDIPIAGGTGHSKAIITPALQHPTDYVFQKDAKARASIGLLIWEISKDGTTKLHPQIMKLKPDEAEVI